MIRSTAINTKLVNRYGCFVNNNYNRLLIRNYSSNSASQRHKEVYTKLYPAMLRVGVIALGVYYVRLFIYDFQ